MRIFSRVLLFSLRIADKISARHTVIGKCDGGQGEWVELRGIPYFGHLPTVFDILPTIFETTTPDPSRNDWSKGRHVTMIRVSLLLTFFIIWRVAFPPYRYRKCVYEYH